VRFEVRVDVGRVSFTFQYVLILARQIPFGEISNCYCD
jgi:hypothetical protein